MFLEPNMAAAPTIKEDFLEEDQPIPGQRFCLLSFLSPEKVLADKNIFLFQKFLDSYEFQSRTQNLEAFLMKTVGDINAKLDKEADALEEKDLSGAAVLCRSSKIRMDVLMDRFQEFVKANEKELRESKLKEKYDDFLYTNREKLEDSFYVKNDFRTTVRGLKLRGTYASQEEAEARSSKLRRQDPIHNIFIGEVGKWLPWDPEPSQIANQEYAEEQLNTLMKKYKENEEHREEFQREQRQRATAQNKSAAVVGPSDSAAPINELFGNEGPADLAIAYKAAKAEAEKAKQFIERVDDQV
jgi:hypothetical protein